MAKLHALHDAGTVLDEPLVRRIGPADLRQALAAGIDDFKAMPTHAFFIALIYPVLGLVLARIILGSDVLPLLFPLMSGFALVGPFAAVGLYELSRRRERGQAFSLAHALRMLRSPAIGSIAALGALMLAVFVVWITTAQLLYQATFGSHVPATVGGFLQEVFATGRGWALILAGNLLGLVFSAVALSLSVVSFPMLIDRDVSAATAVRTSIRAVAANPATMALWGLTVAGALALGFLTLFLGLAVVLPVLGHATWHLYRRVVAS
ncbi:DUF2189 domain-containing protein [Microvirga sp. GCM10011540]|uniref:DUF2189 domain-containing protein n=1 Tax=Microvirga sp. GCM10011540 TaxID=3317338 RepID=UPI00361C4ACB